ncbi:MAG TPA: hypothetical protein VGS79_04645 [Puia sp.]|nr:hypothetical protein [Puia sp.]
MRKRLVLAISTVAVLLLVFVVLRSILPGKQDAERSALSRVTKPDNIDSLTALILKDKHYHIEDVYFDHEDNTLLITIKGEKTTARHFDTVYHISALRSIDRITIIDPHNRVSDTESKKGVRLLAAFEEKWCSGNDCRPLTTRIKQELAGTASYKSIQLWIDWLADSAFIVVDSFQMVDASGHIAPQKVMAQIDMQGRIWTYDVIAASSSISCRRTQFGTRARHLRRKPDRTNDPDNPDLHGQFLMVSGK